jgi:hypothetical protein
MFELGNDFLAAFQSLTNRAHLAYSLSVIETPPENRFPVQTYVLEQNMSFIKEALERELSRDGLGNDFLAAFQSLTNRAHLAYSYAMF